MLRDVFGPRGPVFRISVIHFGQRFFKMVRIDSSVEIARPLDRVFNYCVDVRSWPEWMGEEVEVEQTSTGRIGVGTTFRGSIKGLGPQWNWTGNLSEYEPGRKCGYLINSEKCHIEASVAFASLESATRLELAYGFQGFGLLRLLSPFLKSAMRKRTNEGLQSLKIILEA
jgi:hypothetical protein